jgi:magnesium-transporting ATPase (P-type)
VLFTKGAPDVLLAHCTHARRGKATVALDAALHAQVLADVAAMTDDALRTLAVARRTLAPDAQIPTDAVNRRPRSSRAWNTSAPWASSTRRERRRPWPSPRPARPASA